MITPTRLQGHPRVDLDITNGTLYHRVDWDDVGSFLIDPVSKPGAALWYLGPSGGAFAGSFMRLHIAPAASMQQSFIDRAEAAGLTIEVRKT